MKPIRSILATAGLSVALCAGAGIAPAFAHHAYGLYDMTKTAEIDGTVASFEWSNPHCWLFVTVASAGGAQATYGFEATSVGEMVRRGWKKNAVAPGDKVKVRFHPVRDGRTAGYMMAVLRPDGKYVGRPPPPGTLGAPPPPVGAGG
jgi:hypothetical protein